MTLRRTIHRREARKRAKARRNNPPSRLSYPQWLTLETLRSASNQLRMADMINRTYNSR